MGWPTSWISGTSSNCVLTPSSFSGQKSRNPSSQVEDSQGGRQRLERISCEKWKSWYWFQWSQDLTYMTPKLVSLEKLKKKKKVYQKCENTKFNKKKVGWYKEQNKTAFLFLFQTSLPAQKDILHLSEGKGEKRRLRGIIPSSRRRYNCGKCSYCSQSPSADGHHSRMDRFGLGLAAEMGGGA